ncbi:MAG: gas vesicle protein [Pseudomonadota bacterium]
MPEPFSLTFAEGPDALISQDQTLVDLVDGLLDHGVVIRGEAWITVADIDLVFLRLDLVLANPDTMQKKAVAE